MGSLARSPAGNRYTAWVRPASRLILPLPPPPPAFKIVPSANIAASGEATTDYGMTAPAGKSGTEFFTGRRWDDENGTDALTVTSGGWTKVAWSVQPQAEAENAAQYEFRVVSSGVALDTYSQYPKWTIGTPAAQSLLLPQGTFARSPALRRF